MRGAYFWNKSNTVGQRPDRKTGTDIRQGTGNVNALREQLEKMESEYKEVKRKRDDRIRELLRMNADRARRDAEF